jgi:hypothetical protein
MHPEAPDTDDADAGLPCAGGLVAATLALMTTWAAPAPDAAVDAEQQRWLIARKVVSNLFFLSNHPEVGPGLRNVMVKVHLRWVEIAQGAQPAAAPREFAAAPVEHVLPLAPHLH